VEQHFVALVRIYREESEEGWEDHAEVEAIYETSSEVEAEALADRLLEENPESEFDRFSVAHDGHGDVMVHISTSREYLEELAA